MARKVVEGDDMFFKDDIQIIDVEIAAPLSMPSNLPIFSRDELQIFYDGHIYVAVKERTPDALIKVYTETFGLKEIESPKEQEDEYFSGNSTLIDKLKADFIERAVNGISLLDDGSLKGTLGPQISSELIEKITQEYASLTPSGTSTKFNDGSVFNSYMKDCEQMLVLDGKAYKLITIPEYISKFQKSFEKSFYKKVQSMCCSAAPEEVYQLLTDNSHFVHRKVLPMVRNKIWHSNRSSKLLLDGTYWLPEFEGKTDNFVSKYEKLLERKIKIDTAKKYG